MADEERPLQLAQIAARIRQRRRELGSTQEALAEKATLSKSFVSELESAVAAASGLAYLRVAQALDVTVQWLLTGLEPADAQRAQASISAPEHLSRMPLVSKLAEEKNWSHKFTLDVTAALGAVVARRTLDGHRWEPSREDILNVAKALREEGGK